MLKPYEDRLNRLYRQEQERRAAQYRLVQISAAGHTGPTFRLFSGGVWIRLIVSLRNLRRPASRQTVGLIPAARR